MNVYVCLHLEKIANERNGPTFVLRDQVVVYNLIHIVSVTWKIQVFIVVCL